MLVSSADPSACTAKQQRGEHALTAFSRALLRPLTPPPPPLLFTPMAPPESGAGHGSTGCTCESPPVTARHAPGGGCPGGHQRRRRRHRRRYLIGYHCQRVSPWVAQHCRCVDMNAWTSRGSATRYETTRELGKARQLHAKWRRWLGWRRWLSGERRPGRATSTLCSWLEAVGCQVNDVHVDDSFTVLDSGQLVSHKRFRRALEEPAVDFCGSRLASLSA